MTDLEFIERKIREQEIQLHRAEALYHHATLHGSVPERSAALADCQRIRARLIETMHCRDQVAGGVTDGKED